METRKYHHLEALNALALHDFVLTRIEEDENGVCQNVIFRASAGYPEHFRAEIRFIETEYLECACFFLFATLRQASLKEFPLARKYTGHHIYCFEEFTKNKPYRYYIIAKDVEITVYYAGENIETIFGESNEAGGNNSA
jgi:hypothetical protein